jgi:glycine dehydrogenase subunit 1
MRYLPLTAQEKRKILDACGVASFEELTAQVPAPLRVRGLLDIEPALTESKLLEHVSELGKRNAAVGMQSHLGQGAYDHEWPSVIDQITNRGEFLTAYTPYQPEISQGTLQAIFEFQSMIGGLYGCEVANASLYDGSTAVVEGVLMAARLQSMGEGAVVYVSQGMFDRTRDILQTYLEPLGLRVETWTADAQKFLSTTATLKSGSAPVAAVVMQSPNKWGLVEDWRELTAAAEKLGTRSVAYVSHPHSLALFTPPGSSGVDIVTGEGQPLGIPVGFGGPYLGLFGCRKKDVRQLPGRLVGATVDARGQRAFCTTLSTREQHIRREKATSNICSNQNLMALRATMYLTLMGEAGLVEVATSARAKASYARDLLRKSFADTAPDLRVLEGELFNEITVLVPQKKSIWIDEVKARAEHAGILPGLPVTVPPASAFVSGLSIAFTERHTKADVDRLVQVLTTSAPARNPS